MKTFPSITKCLEQAEKDITRALISVVNHQAFATRKNVIQNIKNDFTLRNNFTEKSLWVEQCPRSAKRLSEIQSRIGMLERAEYMKRQETGGVKLPKSGSSSLAIPSAYARSGKTNAGRVQRKYQINNLRSVKLERKFSSSRARLVARAYVSKKTGEPFRMNDQFFIATSFKKSGNDINFQKRELYNFQKKSTFTPSTPWLEPATEEAVLMRDEYFREAMDALS